MIIICAVAGFASATSIGSPRATRSPAGVRTRRFNSILTPATWPSSPRISTGDARKRITRRRPWGERSFYLHDPWGNPLSFTRQWLAYVRTGVPQVCAPS